MSLLSKCVRVSDDHELGRMEVNSQRFEYVTYDFEGGKSGRKIQLVSTQVTSYCTIKFYIFSLEIYIDILAHFERGGLVIINVLAYMLLLLFYQVRICDFIEEFF